MRLNAVVRIWEVACGIGFFRVSGIWVLFLFFIGGSECGTRIRFRGLFVLSGGCSRVFLGVFLDVFIVFRVWF